MVGGSMGGSSMSMGAGNRHLEVHVKSLATGKVVMGVVPTIGLHDKTAMSSMAMTVKVPVVAMEGSGRALRTSITETTSSSPRVMSTRSWSP